MLPRVKEKAERLQHNEIMLKINVQKNNPKDGRKCKVKLFLLSHGRNEISFCFCTSEVRKGKMKNTILSHVNAIGWTKRKQNNVLFTVVIFLTQSFLSF